MAANTHPIFVLKPRCGVVRFSTANTNRDGTGTVATLFTAATLATDGSVGSVVERVRVKGTVTTTAGMIRLFVHDGSNFFLVGELTVDAITVSASVAAWEEDWTPPGGALQLPSGYSLRVSTHNAEQFDAVAIGGDY